MKYDFTSVIDRTGKDSIAWENIPVPNAEIAEGFDRIPMWVADMNFQTAPSVCEAITKRLEHQVFGYFNPSEEYYNSIINWQKVRNGVEGLTKEAIGYENGCQSADFPEEIQRSHRLLLKEPHISFYAPADR